jgi:phage/plasmid-associated DNA primase
VLNEEHQSLQRENHRLARRLAKVEHQNRKLRQRLDEARREQHRQTHPFRRKKTQAGHLKKPGRPKPNLSTDQATWARFQLLPFTTQFERDDSWLGRLKVESPGILNWMLAGWRDYQENGLFYPQALACQKEELKAECDQYATFRDLFLEPAADGKVRRDDAYKLFKIWYEEENPKTYIPHSRTFARELRRLGAGEHRTKEARFWTGFWLSSDAQDWLQARNTTL